VSRDGNYQVNIPLDPDGQLDPGGRQVLEDMAAWMAIHGEGIKGSSAWKVWGEGSVVMARGNLKQAQARTPYTGKDLRFTVGKDGALYAWLMAWPAEGTVTITSLAPAQGLWSGPVGNVRLLGSPDPVAAQRTDQGLVVTLPSRPAPGFAWCLRIANAP
jgi:alpha-L-fucosidase